MRSMASRCCRRSFFIIAYVWTMVVGALGYRAMRATQMATQYSWAYERVGIELARKGQSG